MIIQKQATPPPSVPCMECGEPIYGEWYTVDGDPVCSRPDCGPDFVFLASPEGQAQLRADREARPAQYRPIE